MQTNTTLEGNLVVTEAETEAAGAPNAPPHEDEDLIHRRAVFKAATKRISDARAQVMGKAEGLLKNDEHLRLLIFSVHLL